MQEARKDIFPKNETFPEGGGVSVFSWLTGAGTTIAPWYSKRRDLELRKFWKGNDHLSGAIYSIIARMTHTPFRVEARDKSISSHVRQAEEYNVIFHQNSESRSDASQKGWTHTWAMFLEDHFGQDNGSFLLIDGPGRPDGPITGRPTKLIHVDSYQVTRKADREFPITFTDWNGKVYKIHHSRVIAMSSMASPQQNMYGVGVCAISRCINVAQILMDQLVYKQEKLGSRPKERLIIGKKGVTAEDIAKAFMAVDEHANAQGLTRYGKTAVLAPNERSTASEIDIDVQDLVDAGQIFNEQESTTLGLYTIALAFGVPARWIWPATSSGATKADATLAHIAGVVQGPGEILNNILELLDYKFLPPQLKMVADYQDDEQDRQQAEIRKARAEQRKTDIEDQVYTIRVARERALSVGDLTQEQFNEMELQDGRLPSGDPILAAFNLRDAQVQELLKPVLLQATDGKPLDIDSNDPIDMIIAIDDAAFAAMEATQLAPSAQQKRKARTVLAALGELKTMYEQRATDETADEVVAEMNLQAQAAQEPKQEQPKQLQQAQEQKPEEQKPGQAQEETTEENQEQTQGQETEEEMEEKAFNFGARAGEIIGGGLARDPEGKFISADQMGAAIRSRLLEKIKNRKGTGKTDEENRAVVLQELAKDENFPVGGLDALVTLGAGGIPDDGDVTDGLVELGLAKVNPDGSVQISSQGASVLIAANSGSARRAKEAMIRAQAAKKPTAGKKPKGGGGGKPDKEQEQRDNRASVAGDLGLDLEPLAGFSEGGELDNETATALAQDGLVEFDTDGNPRLTSAGRSVLNSANRGDSGKARDALSRAKEQVQKKQDKIADLRNKATGWQDDATELQGDIDDMDAQIAGLDPEQDAAKIASLQSKRERTQERMDRLNERIADAKDNATKLEQSIGGIIETPPEEGKGLIAWVKALLGWKDGLSDIRLGIRAAIRALWQGRTDTATFVDDMVGTLTRNLRRAFAEGAKRAGIEESELTEAEIKTRDDFINGQFLYLPQFARDIDENNRANGGKLTPLFLRAELWVNRYNELEQQAFMLASGNKKIKWFLGNTKEHCSDCLNYNGRVYRASTWAKYNISPRTTVLSCRGYNCLCFFEETGEPVTPGYPPKPENG